MSRLSSAHRWGAALLSVALLAGTVLPALQHICASPTAVQAPSLTASKPLAAPHGAAHPESASRVASPPGSSPGPIHAPADGPVHDCVDPCLDGCACVVQSIPVDLPDLRLPERSLQEEGRPVLLVADRIAVPSPVRMARTAVPVDLSPPPSPVRLHVWTATFLK